MKEPPAGQIQEMLRREKWFTSIHIQLEWKILA